MMATVDIRQRTAYLFLAVVVGHVILISAQVNTARGIPVLEAVVFGGFAEVQRLAGDKEIEVVLGERTSPGLAAAAKSWDEEPTT